MNKFKNVDLESVNNWGRGIVASVIILILLYFLWSINYEFYQFGWHAAGLNYNDALIWGVCAVDVIGGIAFIVFFLGWLFTGTIDTEKW